MFSKFSSSFDGRNRAAASPLPAEREYPGYGHHHYDPNQPRVPKGNPDGGQWTRGWAGHEHSWSEESDRQEPRGLLAQPWTRLAAAHKPPPRGRFGVLALIIELYGLILKYRQRNPPQDLFGPQEAKNSTIAVTTIDGKAVFGVNSDYHTYTSADDAAARRLRAVLIGKYPDLMRTGNIGQRPNDAIFHAEVTVLLRAAILNSGTLSGRALEVVTDRPLCPSCVKVLPYVGLELGNPAVTFTDRKGARYTMRNGEWKGGEWKR